MVVKFAQKKSSLSPAKFSLMILLILLKSGKEKFMLKHMLQETLKKMML